MTCKDCVFYCTSLDGCMFSTDPDQPACELFRKGVEVEEDEDEHE